MADRTEAKPKQKRAPLHTAVSYSHSDGTLAETVVSEDGRFNFAVLNKAGEFSIAPHLLNGTASPIYPAFNLKALWQAGALRLPSGLAQYESRAQLVSSIKAFIRRYGSVPEEWLTVIAHYVLLSWVYDRFTAVPYLRFLGEPGTGKTRLLQILAAICYKALVASGNITGPALFRSIHLIQGTLIVDEGDFRNSEEWSDIIKVLNNGYIAGFPVIRCNTSQEFCPEAFCVYGPKVVSTRSRFADHALETRCITLEMKQEPLPEHIPYQLPPEFEIEAGGLRNRLLQWRFTSFGCIKANETELRCLDLEPRLGQTGTSLCAVAGDEDTRGQLVEFLFNYSEAEKADSPSSIVVQAIFGILATTGRFSATVGEVAQAASEAARPDLDTMTAKRVGGILRSLGFKPKRTKQGYIVAFDADTVAALKRQYPALVTVNVAPAGGERVNVPRQKKV